MKWSSACYLVALVFLLSVLLTQASNKKEVNLLLWLTCQSILLVYYLNCHSKAQSTKHKPVKVHKTVLGHWDTSNGAKAKAEHHNVKEVQKHAPLTVSHHEAKSQADLAHSKKKPLHSSGSKSDLKLQDLAAEDAIHHKVQAHKSHSSHDNHGHNVHHQNGHKMTPMKMMNNHASNGGSERLATGAKPEKGVKPSKKMILNKNKKIKRTKRLHKQYIF